ncbi:MAG: tetratricopeptide repeat protein [Planctomycetota bacterium]
MSDLSLPAKQGRVNTRQHNLFVVVLLILCIGCDRSKEELPPTPRTEASTIEFADPEAASTEESFDETNSKTESTVATAVEEPASLEKGNAEIEMADPAAVRDAAIESLEAGDLDRAFELTRRAKRLDPANPETVFLNARVLAARNRFAEAVQALDDLAAAVPEAKLPVLGQTAEWMVLQGRYDEAEKRYTELLDVVGEGGLVSRRLAQLFLRQGRRVEAAEHLRVLCREGNIEEVELRALLSIAKPISGEQPDNDELEPIGALGRARLLASGEDWRAARAEIESVGSPSIDESALRARVYASVDEFDSLAQWLEGAGKPTETVPPDGWFAIACLAAHQGKHARAVDALCNGVQLDPTDAEAYAQLSKSLAELGMDEQAKDAAMRAELLRQTQEIGKRMSNAESPGSEDLASLIKLLRQLRRPSEALAWSAVATIYAQSRSEISRADAIKKLEQINQDRLVTASESSDIKQFILCGIDPEQLPPGDSQ